MPKHKVRGFQPDRAVTRKNSETSKATSIDYLFNRDYRTIALLTTPGPATPFEQIEEDKIRSSYRGLTLDVYRYEIDPTTAEQHELICGDMTVHAHAATQAVQLTGGDPDFQDYDAVVIEWDGTQTHSAHLQNGTWDRVMATIRSLQTEWELPVVLAYTHSLRRGFLVQEVEPTPGDMLSYKYKQKAHKALPWEGYLLQKLTKDLDLPVQCLWNSREHWLRHRLRTKTKAQPRANPTYRWVFAINPR